MSTNSIVGLVVIVVAADATDLFLAQYDYATSFQFGQQNHLIVYNAAVGF